MDPVTLKLFVDAIASGIGVASQIAKLAQRVQAGEQISLKEIKVEQAKVNTAVSNWDDVAKGAKEVSGTNGHKDN